MSASSVSQPDTSIHSAPSLGAGKIVSSRTRQAVGGGTGGGDGAATRARATVGGVLMSVELVEIIVSVVVVATVSSVVEEAVVLEDEVSFGASSVLVATVRASVEVAKVNVSVVVAVTVSNVLVAIVSVMFEMVLLLADTAKVDVVVQPSQIPGVPRSTTSASKSCDASVLTQAS